MGSGDMAVNWNPYSVTLRDGGGVFTVREPGILAKFPKTGYTVGIAEGDGATIRLHGTNHPVKVLEVVMNYVASTYLTELVGTWLVDNVITIDPVVIIEDFDTAVIVGKALKQKAIYDNAQRQVIDL